MHRVFPPAIVAAIRDDRLPSGGEIEAVAAKMWHEAFTACANSHWSDLPGSSAERNRVIQAAETALVGNDVRPTTLVA
jgi:hypothetical protein